MATDPIPTTQFGKVVGRFIYVVGDTTSDPDNLPDITPATGTITFTPDASHIIVPGPPTGTTALPRPVPVNLDSQGYIIDGAGAQGVWLLTGSYTVTFAFQGVPFPTTQIVVTPEHTAVAPLDLALYVPAPTDPTIQFIVNEQIYLDTIAARDEVVAAKNHYVGGTNPGAKDYPYTWWEQLPNGNWTLWIVTPD